MTPTEYAEKYHKPATAVAYELTISENAFRRYLLTGKSKSSPSPPVCRVAQLLDFIRENGLNPPEPIFFE